LLIVLGFSVGIELLQYFSSAWGSYRAADVNDIILNVFGACLGLAVASLLGFRRGPWGPLKKSD
jgi:glycopeptide antibiotics resistance protein